MFIEFVTNENNGANVWFSTVCSRSVERKYVVLEEAHIVFKCRFISFIMSAKLVGSINIHLVLTELKTKRKR
jgi:hypothetical protein